MRSSRRDSCRIHTGGYIRISWEYGTYSICSQTEHGGILYSSTPSLLYVASYSDRIYVGDTLLRFSFW